MQGLFVCGESCADNAEGHLPGLGESLVSERAARGVLCVGEIPPIAGRLRGLNGDGIVAG